MRVEGRTGAAADVEDRRVVTAPDLGLGQHLLDWPDKVRRVAVADQLVLQREPVSDVKQRGESVG